MVSTMDDNTTELSENFMVVINSTDQPSVVDIGSFIMAFITIEDNDPGTYIPAQTCMHTVANAKLYMQLHEQRMHVYTWKYMIIENLSGITAGSPMVETPIIWSKDQLVQV